MENVFQNFSNADGRKSSTFCPNLIQPFLTNKHMEEEKIKNSPHQKAGGLQLLCLTDFPISTQHFLLQFLMNCLTEEINWSCLVSPESSQVVGRAIYPILYQLGHTCGGWEFCNSFHLTSIVSDMIHELGLQGKIQKLYIIYSALRVSKKIRSFCSWRAEEREQKSVTVLEYTRDVN